MKFAVGYQLAEGDEIPFSKIISSYAGHISEVYFPWLDIATGRSALSTRRGHTDWTAQARMEKELAVFKRMGIKLDLLLNANCYGRLSMSEELRNKILSVIEHLGMSECGGIDIVTTASPFIAETVKKNFPEIEVRASVNMWIGTIKAMRYMSDIFDSFYVQREYNRDIPYILTLKEWCDNNGKGIYMLANSGCLSYCTGHSFHDNLVAHEAEICETINTSDFLPYTCWRYLRNRENWKTILQNSWVRPEDMHNYEKIFNTVKLATRMHSSPLLVISAYARGSFEGNLADLCEPGFAPALAPFIIDNKALPDDFFKVTSSCDKRCDNCSYCAEALEGALVEMDM